MAKLVSVNHFIINPKEYNGRRVVTFKDIDLVHGRADGTARYRFRDNKKHFIEGEDYFVVTPQTLENAKMGEIRPSGIESVNVRGTTFLTETGYLMLVKSFTDDLAWSVQRELVNNYFRFRTEQKEKPERRQVVDIPRNPEYQKIFAKVRKNIDALDALMNGLNRYISQEDAEAYVKVIDSVGITILKLTDSIGRMKYGLMTEPY
ncbi:ORF6N domain-containing protein [Anaerotignum faecicola]